MTSDDLQSKDYKEWYDKNSVDYQAQLSSNDLKAFDGVSVDIYIGTWCGDTKFLVPKFIKEWEAIGLDARDLNIIALHNKGENYKQGPNDETIGKNIHKVPTFIFKREDKELGRIVERTVFDLHTDMKLIAEDGIYEERYQAQKMLNEFLSDLESDTLTAQANLNAAYQLIRREVSTSSELNSYGYVLMAQNELEKAEFVFLLNTFLFRYEPNIHDSYAACLMKLERYEQAKDEFHEVLKIKGEDKNATQQLALIYDLLEEESKIKKWVQSGAKKETRLIATLNST